MTNGCTEIEEGTAGEAVGHRLDRGVMPLLQGGMSNAELLAAWRRKLPGIEPTERDLSAFAVGVEVGFNHARNLGRQD